MQCKENQCLKTHSGKHPIFYTPKYIPFNNYTYFQKCTMEIPCIYCLTYVLIIYIYFNILYKIVHWNGLFHVHIESATIPWQCPIESRYMNKVLLMLENVNTLYSKKRLFKNISFWMYFWVYLTLKYHKPKVGCTNFGKLP